MGRFLKNYHGLWLVLWKEKSGQSSSCFCINPAAVSFANGYHQNRDFFVICLIRKAAAGCP
jgi:hypothetical protein